MIQKTILSLLLATLPTIGAFAGDHGQPSGMNRPAAPAGPCDNLGPAASRLILESSARDDAGLAVAAAKFAAEHTPLFAAKGIDWEAARAVPGERGNPYWTAGAYLSAVGSVAGGLGGFLASVILIDAASTPRAMGVPGHREPFTVAAGISMMGSGLAASGVSSVRPQQPNTERPKLQAVSQALAKHYTEAFGWDAARSAAFLTKLSEAVVSAVQSSDSVTKIEAALAAIDPLTLAEQVDPGNAIVFAELKRWRTVQRPPVFTPAERLKKLRETQRDLEGVSRALGIETKALADCDRLREIFAKAEERLTALCEVNR